jgi:hypothetical protein
LELLESRERARMRQDAPNDPFSYSWCWCPSGSRYGDARLFENSPVSYVVRPGNTEMDIS